MDERAKEILDALEPEHNLMKHFKEGSVYADLKKPENKAFLMGAAWAYTVLENVDLYSRGAVPEYIVGLIRMDAKEDLLEKLVCSLNDRLNDLLEEEARNENEC